MKMKKYVFMTVLLFSLFLFYSCTSEMNIGNMIFSKMTQEEKNRLEQETFVPDKEVVIEGINNNQTNPVAKTDSSKTSNEISENEQQEIDQASLPSRSETSTAEVEKISDTDNLSGQNDTTKSNDTFSQSVTIQIDAIGDIILHQSVIDGGMQQDGSYLYDNLFRYVSPILQSADYSIAGYEGTLNGPPYSGYPLFGAPDEIMDALGNAGIDMITTANNHAMDRKLAGLKRTAQIVKDYDMEVVGTRSKPEEPVFKIVDIKGIKVGFTAYTWETIGTESVRTINGIPLPKEAEALIDSFNPSRTARYKKDLEGMKNRIQEMKAAGAECVIFLIHWGDEYITKSNKVQQNMAQFLADNGVDIIFGYHPHVLQEIAIVPSSDKAKQMVVFYSLSGFVSNMEYGTHKTNGYAEDSIIAKAFIERNELGEVHILKAEYEGTYVYKDKTGKRVQHYTLPVKAVLATPDNYDLGKGLQLVKNANVRIQNVLEKSNKITGITIQPSR